MMINKNVNQLERERIEKIKGLSLDEVKAYIDNLNKKMFKSLEENDSESVDYYSNKLLEVFDLTRDKYVNLESYSLIRKYDITTAKMIENNTKKHITYVSLTSEFVMNSILSLNHLYCLLRYALMMYYHNYYLNESSLVEDLLIHLSMDYDFENEDFENYASDKVNKYNEKFMTEMNELILRLKDFFKYTCKITDLRIAHHGFSEIRRINDEIAHEKEYVIKMGDSDEGVKTLKDGDYLHLLDVLKKAYESLEDSLFKYNDLKDKIEALLDSDDGFSVLKESEYDISCQSFGDSVFNKEEFIAMRPSYDMRECKFIPSDYFSDK